MSHIKLKLDRSHIPIVVVPRSELRRGRPHGLVGGMRVERGRREVVDAEDGVDSRSGARWFLLLSVLLCRAETLAVWRILEVRHL